VIVRGIQEPYLNQKVVTAQPSVNEGTPALVRTVLLSWSGVLCSTNKALSRETERRDLTVGSVLVDHVVESCPAGWPGQSR